MMTETPPESHTPDLSKFRAAVALRERAVRAALEHHRWVKLPPSQQYARATYDAVKEILVQAGREAAAKNIKEWAKQDWLPMYETAEEYASFFARLARGENIK